MLRFGGLALHCFSKGGPLTTGDTVENATLEVGPGFLCLKNPLGGFDDTGDYKNQRGLRAGHDTFLKYPSYEKDLCRFLFQ